MFHFGLPSEPLDFNVDHIKRFKKLLYIGSCVDVLPLPIAKTAIYVDASDVNLELFVKYVKQCYKVIEMSKITWTTIDGRPLVKMTFKWNEMPSLTRLDHVWLIWLFKKLNKKYFPFRHGDITELFYILQTLDIEFGTNAAFKSFSEGVDLIWCSHFDPNLDAFSGIELSKVPAAIIPTPSYSNIKQIKNFYFVHHITFAFDYLTYPLVPHPFQKSVHPKDFSFGEFYKLFGNLISSQPLTNEEWEKKVCLFKMNKHFPFSFTDLQMALWNGDRQMVEKALKEEANHKRSYLPRNYVVSSKSMEYNEIIQLLTNNGYEINQNTFSEAIYSNNVELVKILLDHGANVNLESSKGWTPLETAILSGDKEIIGLLVEHGAKVDSKTVQNRTLMELTACQGYFKVLKKMCDVVKNSKNQDVERELMFLKLIALAWRPKLKHGRYTATLKKLESWDKSKRSEIVNRNICSRLKMYSPFSRACGSGNIDLVEYFIKVCKPNVECLSRQSINEHQLLIKTTPIGIAAAKGHLKIVELLIKHGARIDILSSVRQYSPVFMACMNNHLEIVKLLIENDADIHLPSLDGRTCLMVSVKSEEICKLLLDHGAMVNATDKKGKTALQYATEENQIEVSKLLLQHGAEQV